MAEEDPFAQVPDPDPLATKCRNLEKALAAFGFKGRVHFDSDNWLHIALEIPHQDSWCAANLTDGGVNFIFFPPKV